MLWQPLTDVAKQHRTVMRAKHKRSKDIWDVSPEIRPEDVAGVERRNLADALFKAVVRCVFHRVRFMLHNGVSATVINDAGQNLLIAALYIHDDVKRARMFQLLVDSGADVCHVDRGTGRDVLAWAACLGRADQVQFILDAVMGEIDLQRRDLEGMTPLHHAVIGGHTKVTEILVAKLVRYCLSVDIADDNGLTPYIYARRLARPAIAQVLVDRGHCSRQQLDSVTFRSAEEWERIGRREKQQREREKLQRQKHMSRRQANKSSQASQTRPPHELPKPLPVSIVVESDEPLVEAGRLTHSRVSTAASVDIAAHESSVSPHEPATGGGLPTFSLSRPAPYRLVASSADSAERLIALTTPTRRPSSGELERMLQRSLRPDTERARKPIREELKSLLDMQAVQCSHSFRPNARLPTPPEQRAHRLQGVSTLAVVFGTKKSKPDSMTSSKRSVVAMSSMVTTSNKFVENLTEKKRRKTLQLPAIV